MTENIVASFASNSLVSLCTSEEWIIDTGCTAHMTFQCQSLEFPKSFDNALKSVKLPNRKITPISHIGSISTYSFFKLHNVLHVVDFNFNLLSKSRFTSDNNCSVIFYAQLCIF